MPDRHAAHSGWPVTSTFGEIMNPFRYKISLRFYGNEFDPEDVTRELSIAPNFHWKQGDQIINPPETPSKGIRRKSYWSYRFSPIGDDIESSILAILRTLLPHKDFIERTQSKGVNIELFIGLFADENFGFTIAHTLAKPLSDLRIDLGFDIYPEAEPKNTEQIGPREPSTARVFQGKQTMTRTQTCQSHTPPTVAGR